MLKQFSVEAGTKMTMYFLTYQVGRLNDILRSGEDVESLQRNGILIDTEADGIHSVAEEGKTGELQKNER